MQDGLVKERQNEALMRFVVMLFSITGLSSFFRTASALPVCCQMLSLRSAAIRLLQLARVVTYRRVIAPNDFPRYFQPPDILPKEPHEFLTAQNVCARIPALYRAWDELEAQAGRLVRWRTLRESETGLFVDFGQCDENIQTAQQRLTTQALCLADAGEKMSVLVPRLSRATRAPPCPDTS